jgi:hypothetical protein
MKPDDHKLMLDRIKRLLAARERQERGAETSTRREASSTEWR